MCKLVIDTGALARNLEKLRHYTSARIIAVVKGGGYGLGLVPYARWLTAQGVDMLAVSSVAEAAALRDAGITADVLKSLVGQRMGILVEGESARRKSQMTGKCGRNISVNYTGGSADQIGRIVPVLITGTGSNTLRGEYRNEEANHE